MSSLTLEELYQRLTALERQVAEIYQRRTPPEKDWRSTLGMFTDDPGMRELFDEAARIRQADRDAARNDPQYFGSDT